MDIYSYVYDKRLSVVHVFNEWKVELGEIIFISKRE